MLLKSSGISKTSKHVLHVVFDTVHKATEQYIVPASNPRFMQLG